MSELQWQALERVLNHDPCETQRFVVTGCGPAFDIPWYGTAFERLRGCLELAIAEQDFELASAIKDLMYDRKYGVPPASCVRYKA